MLRKLLAEYPGVCHEPQSRAGSQWGGEGSARSVSVPGRYVLVVPVHQDVLAWRHEFHGTPRRRSGRILPQVQRTDRNHRTKRCGLTPLVCSPGRGEEVELRLRSALDELPVEMPISSLLQPDEEPLSIPQAALDDLSEMSSTPTRRTVRTVRYDSGSIALVGDGC